LDNIKNWSHRGEELIVLPDNGSRRRNRTNIYLMGIWKGGGFSKKLVGLLSNISGNL
jgi:hypothetical protein